MNEQLGRLLAASRKWLSSIEKAAAEHRYWLRLGLLTMLGLAALGSWGSQSNRRDAVNRLQLQELEKVEAVYGRWARDLQLPTPAESLTWRQSEESLAALAVDANHALTIARLVAAHGGVLGVANLRVSMAPADEFPPADATAVGGWEAQPEGDGLVVEFDAGFAGVMAFLANLPVQAVVNELNLTDGGGFLHARMTIATRRIQRNG